MGTRFQRSISLGHGLRLNISKTGVGISIGRPGMRFGIHSSGRRHMSLGIPGTGISYRRYYGNPRKKNTDPHGIRPLACLRGKLLAPRYEREFVRGLLRLTTDDSPEARRKTLEHFESAARLAKIKGKKWRSPDFFAGFCLAPDDADKARGYLQTVLAGDEPLPDRLQARYITDPTIPIELTHVVGATVPVSRLAAALLLAGLLKAKGEVSRAITVLERFRDGPERNDPALIVSLAELYCASGRHEDAIQITDGLRNDDDLTCQAMVLRARALAANGVYGPALSAFKEAVKSTKRGNGVRMAAHYERGLVYEVIGDPERARKDFETVAGMDIDFADVASRVDRPAESAPSSPEQIGAQWIGLPPALRLRQARRRAGLTQRELAKRAGIGQVTISNLEIGSTIPRRETLERLLRACEITPHGEPPISEVSAAEPTVTSMEEEAPTSIT